MKNNAIRKIAVVALTAAVALSSHDLSARRLSPAEAYSRAFPQAASPAARTPLSIPAPVATIADSLGRDCIYLFADADGLSVVGADDCAIALLGHTDRPLDGPEQLPPPVRAWLDGYASEISHAMDLQTSAPAPTAARLPDIAPLVAAHWNQTAPFNDLCPIFRGTEHCVTGCVATAMAQIMYHHRFPEHGIGEKSSTVEIQGRTETLHADFANTTYRWDLMETDYNSSSSAEARTAVATLMAHIGIAGDMIYDFEGSNLAGVVQTELAEKMMTYFGYSKGMMYCERSFYSDEGWAALLYGELEASRPVLFAGYDNTTGAGHTFVCDGYESKTNFYHFNWGWGGLADGYYSLQAVAPQYGGVGGGTYNFTKNQHVVTHIMPPAADVDDEYVAHVCAASNLSFDKTYYSYGEAMTVKSTGGDYTGFINRTMADTNLRIDFAIEAVAQSDSAVYYIPADSRDYVNRLSYAQAMIRFPIERRTLPADDSYDCRVVARGQGCQRWQPVEFKDGFPHNLFSIDTYKEGYCAYNESSNYSRAVSVEVAELFGVDEKPMAKLSYEALYVDAARSVNFKLGLRMPDSTVLTEVADASAGVRGSAKVCSGVLSTYLTIPETLQPGDYEVVAWASDAPKWARKVVGKVRVAKALEYTMTADREAYRVGETVNFHICVDGGEVERSGACVFLIWSREQDRELKYEYIHFISKPGEPYTLDFSYTVSWNDDGIIAYLTDTDGDNFPDYNRLCTVDMEDLGYAVEVVDWRVDNSSDGKGVSAWYELMTKRACRIHKASFELIEIDGFASDFQLDRHLDVGDAYVIEVPLPKAPGYNGFCISKIELTEDDGLDVTMGFRGLSHYDMSSVDRIMAPTGNTLAVTPNPVSDRCCVSGAIPGSEIRIVSATGAVVASLRSDENGRALVEIEGWPSGFYIVGCGSMATRLIVAH